MYVGGGEVLGKKRSKFCGVQERGREDKCEDLDDRERIEQHLSATAMLHGITQRDRMRDISHVPLLVDARAASKRHKTRKRVDAAAAAAAAAATRWPRRMYSHGGRAPVCVKCVVCVGVERRRGHDE